MALSEADTRAKLIDPALHARGWTEELIRREETAGGVEIIDGRARRRSRGRVDYTLRVRLQPDTQPIAVALIEAKTDDAPASLGLEQAKGYSRRLNVPFVYCSNGHQYVEYDHHTGMTSRPRALSRFPTPEELRARYEAVVGFSLHSEAAKPLLAPYPGGEACRYYFQDAAIRATLEKFGRGEKRALLSLATGSGKTRIAVYLLKKIADAGQLRRALFVCDRDELRWQGLNAFQNVFGAEVAQVTSASAQKNARILIATYQTLNVSGEEDDARFLTEHYPVNYFSHIIIDECHRSAWGKWSNVLTRNPDAYQIGLTATPRRIIGGNEQERSEDEEISANNLTHFGEPVYEYDMSQGIEDGYLAACEVVRREIDIDKTGITREDIERRSAQVTDPVTGRGVSLAEAKERYEAPSFEDLIQLPDRVGATSADLFQHLLDTGGPEQKTIVFCARDSHADAVATELNNLYARWCAEQGRQRLEPYAFKCTAAGGGSEYLDDLRGAQRSHFIATTVELLTTGVDVPCVRNIVFLKYVRLPIAFYQMVGRGTRIDVATNKLMFRVYDYTNATRLFGGEFVSRARPTRERTENAEASDKERTLRVEGFDVRVTDAGRYIVMNVDGKAMPVTVEEYREQLAARLVAEAATVDEFRRRWLSPADREALLERLPNDGSGVRLLQDLSGLKDYDLYDVLAEAGYGLAPKKRSERAEAFSYKHKRWLRRLPEAAAATLTALVAQFAQGGTEALESQYVFQVRDVVQAGGLAALSTLGKPATILRKAKERILAA